MRAMEISRTALDVEWRRLEVIAENLANVNSTAGDWRPRRLISAPAGDFAAMIDQTPDARHGPAGVVVQDIEALDLPPRLVHEPGNPRADAQGMVAYPAVDHAAEMTLMIKSSRTYEANIVAMNSARQMYSKALELGRRS
jgi:flagellar basal-body rod protein FlgC